MPNAYVDAIARDGFAIVPNALAPAEVSAIIVAVESALDGATALKRGASTYGLRDLLTVVPQVRALAHSAHVRALVEPILGPAAFVVRGLWFDKTPDANWNLPWHRDMTIAVKARVDVPGFHAWTNKAGIPHVLAPLEVLRGMLTVRLHLDPAHDANGPLQVVPGSHLFDDEGVKRTDVSDGARVHTCVVGAGDAVVMRPLLLHASGSAVRAFHRRVVHLEFASEPLPGGLEWYEGDLRSGQREVQPPGHPGA